MTITDHEDVVRHTSIWWFIGGGIRPTSRWRLGESISEVVCLPYPKDARTLGFSLHVYSHWDTIYSDSRYRLRLPAHSVTRRLPNDAVALGSFEAAGIREASPDPLKAKREGRDFYQLYNLKEDPLERLDLVDAERGTFERMQARLLAVLRPMETANDQSPDDEEGEQTLSPETVKQLRALGYAE